MAMMGDHIFRECLQNILEGCLLFTRRVYATQDVLASRTNFIDILRTCPSRQTARHYFVFDDRYCLEGRRVGLRVKKSCEEYLMETGDASSLFCPVILRVFNQFKWVNCFVDFKDDSSVRLFELFERKSDGGAGKNWMKNDLLSPLMSWQCEERVLASDV